MRNKFAAAIAQVGHFVTVEHGGKTVSVLASLQPVFSGERDVSGTGGYGATRQYLLYTSHTTPLLQAGATVTQGDSCFLVERSEAFTYGEHPLYHKARLLLTKEGTHGNPR